MKLPGCTCEGEDHPNRGTTRSTPEIDAVEASVVPRVFMTLLSDGIFVRFRFAKDHVLIRSRVGSADKEGDAGRAWTQGESIRQAATAFHRRSIDTSPSSLPGIGSPAAAAAAATAVAAPVSSYSAAF
jgi:hypothetical protein